MKHLWLCGWFWLGALSSSLVVAQRPDPLQGVEIQQRLNQPVPLDAEFLDETGRVVQLGDYLGRRPVVLALVYYECPMLCTLILNGLIQGLRQVSLEPGRDYQVVVISIDPTETPKLAAAKKTEYLKALARPDSADGWHFLTGSADQIQRVAQAVGFGYRQDPKTKLYVHGSGIMVLTPSGKVARYLLGVDYAPRDLRLGLVEASHGRIGTPVDAVRLFCYHYDPQTGQYGLLIHRVLQLAGGATVVLLGAAVGWWIWRARQPRRQP